MLFALSNAELGLFLDDLGRTVGDPADRTDFRKVLFYLFGFTHVRVLEASRRRDDDTALTARLVAGIELVLVRHKHLLNVEVTQEEWRLLRAALPAPAAAPAAAPDVPAVPDAPGPLYEFGIAFALNLLAHGSVPDLPNASNVLKLLVIAIVNLVTTRLHSFRHRARIKRFVLAQLDALMQRVFALAAEAAAAPLAATWRGALAALVHLFTVVADYDMAAKLGLGALELRLESHARKLWFVLCSVSVTALPQGDLELVDRLRLLVVLALVLRLCLDAAAKTLHVVMVLQWLADHALEGLARLRCMHRCALHGLLRILLLCRERGCVATVLGEVQLDRASRAADPDLAAVVRLLAAAREDEVAAAAAAAPPFGDAALESLRVALAGRAAPLVAGPLLPLDPAKWYSYFARALAKPTDGELVSIVRTWGTLACLYEGCLVGGECCKCSAAVAPQRKPIDALAAVFRVVLDATTPHPSAVVRVGVLVALSQWFCHFRPDELTEALVFGSLSHPARAVRLMAGRVLPLYLVAPDLEPAFRRVFSAVSRIRFDEPHRAHLAELTLAALGALATHTDNGEFLCALLLQLINALGEPNEQHVNLAYAALLAVASAKQLTPYKLLLPFLPSVAERVVKQPRMLLRITDLLGVSRRYFLVRTRDYTTPRLLEYYRHDYIQEIAAALGMSKLQLVTKSLPRIVATYLCSARDEGYIVSVLGNAVPQLRGAALADLVVNVGAVTWFILLQIDEQEGVFKNQEVILSALEYVGRVAQRRAGRAGRGGGAGGAAADAAAAGPSAIDYLVETHILELVQRFSENVHHTKGSKPYLEQVASLRAIEFLVERNIAATATALGQISTCLQATLEHADFQVQAIRCWNVLVQRLDSPHLILLFDIIILLIFQKFDQFEHRAKLVAVQILKKLFGELRDRYNEYALYYFAVPFVAGLDRYYQLDASFVALLRQMLRAPNHRYHFAEFTRRLRTGNRYVVLQALADLGNFVNKNQRLCQQHDFREAAATASVLELLRTLLDTAQAFRNKGMPEVATQCAHALAAMGALDPNKFSLKSVKETVTVVHDFRDYGENAAFLRHFLESIIIRSFWASNNPVKQLYSAYSMQKFLGVLQLDRSVLSQTQDPRGAASATTSTAVWHQFTDISRSTLTPFLTSKYIPPVLKHEPLSYPHFKLNMAYDKWLVDVTSDLLHRAAADASASPAAAPPPRAVIFATCAILVRDHDLLVCHYLLKYVCLSLVILGDEANFDHVKLELLHILQHDLLNLPPDRCELVISCFQAVFEVLDYFNEWVSVATQYVNDATTSTSGLKRSIRLVQAFLEHLPMSLIALRSSECDSFERTILYLEKCHRQGLVADAVVVPTLQRMYANINDFDALSGILRRFATTNLRDKLATFQYSEDWSFAQQSFQVLGEIEDKVANNSKLLASLSDHALHEEALLRLGATVNLQNVLHVPWEWTVAGLNASVALGNVAELSKWLYVADTASTAGVRDLSVSCQIARSLDYLRRGEAALFAQCLEAVFRVVGGVLVLSMASSSVLRNSQLIRQLHALYDLQHIAASTNAVLSERLANTDQLFETQWRILAVHYCAHKVKGDGAAIGDVLLQSARTARHNNRLDVAIRCIMKAMALNEKEANLEYTELLWAQGRQTEAIKNLASIIADGEFKSTQQRAQAQLQYAVWLDESNHSLSTTIIKEYTKAYQLEAIWDKPYYDLGKYYSKIMDHAAGGGQPAGYYEQQTIRFYLKALALGPTYIFEALPKLITVWLDFAQRVPSKESERKLAERKLAQMVADLEGAVGTIPVYVWYTAITQLLSRLAHRHEPSGRVLVTIISSLVQAYPKYSLWYVLSHTSSKDETRRRRVAAALNDALRLRGLEATIDGARLMFASMIAIAQHEVKKHPVVRRMLLLRDFGLALDAPCDALVIPVGSNLEIRLPLGRHTPKSFTAFPKAAAVTFDAFEDSVNIFQLLQRPKQVTIRGLDHRMYRLILKRDDTRKDAKVVEFTTMINRLLLAGAEARRRGLAIANYSVVPLAENLGVIEFVHNAATMKSVVGEQRQRSTGASTSSLDKRLFVKLDAAQKKMRQAAVAAAALGTRTAAAATAATTKNSGSALAPLMELFEHLCTEVAPPVLHQWFVYRFSDPATWYLARNTFTRLAAVMSIVGYIIGLGDRHCENILFLKDTGAVLHIDFDCLFDKGKTLPVPEIVPFRLTQNLVDAMGITGVEGSFRVACEVTATLLRENEALLMNVLETLLYDPLLDWRSARAGSTPEDHLRRVRRKIRGLVDEEGLPMNVHGQVDVLIQEASSPEMLCQMYGGWAPYI